MAILSVSRIKDHQMVARPFCRAGSLSEMIGFLTSHRYTDNRIPLVSRDLHPENANTEQPVMVAHYRDGTQARFYAFSED